MTECQMFTARPHSTAHSTLSGNDRFGRLRFDAEQLKRSAERSSVDRQLVAFDQLLHWHRAKLPSVGGLTGRDFLVVVNRAGAGLQQMQVAVRRVLIERDEHVDLVTHVAHWRIARANRQECMSATDDRLIGVVGIEVQPAPREDPGENVSRGGDALAVFAANADREIYIGKCCHLVIEYCSLVSGAGLSKLKRRQILSASIRPGSCAPKADGSPHALPGRHGDKSQARSL